MVLYPTRGVSELGRIDPDAVMARYGLTPQQYPDFAALRGDPSDNLPSIPGVGEKTAAKWIREFGSLAELTDRVDEVTGKAGDALRAHLANVLLNRQLTELIRDVPLDVAPADLGVRPWDRDAVHRLFDELEFRVLRERLFATLQSAEPEAEGGIEVQGGALGPGAVRAWLDAHARDGRRVGLAFFGITGGATAGDVAGIALAAGEPSVEARAAGAAAGVPQGGYLDVTTLTPDDEAALGEWLADPAVPKAAHDAKSALHALRGRGWSLAGLTSDTALAAYLSRPGQRSFDLADLALRHLRRELRVEGEADDGQLSLLGRADALSADAPSGEDEADAARASAQMVAASAVAELADALDAELAERGGSELLAELELPLEYVLADLETAGIAVDGDALAALEAEFAAQVKQAAQDAYGVIGKEINLGSPKQLQVVLFDELGMPKTKRTKTGYTTDADALQTLFEQTGHEFLSHLLVHRDATRLKVTVEGLLKSVADDGRIHTTYSQTIAATGRLSSTEPNLQNVPIRTAAGRRIRENFVVGRDHAELMTADYSQIEMRIMAHLSEDAALIEAFRSQHDFHAETAARVFGVDATAVSPGPARQDQGHELRAGLRAVRIRAVQPAADLHRGGPRADGRLLRGLRRGARLPAQRGRRRPQGRLHRHHHGPPPLPARPHQRQPAAPRDGRADGVERPDPGQRRRHHQGRHARGAPGAHRRGVAQPDAAAGARRARARGGRGRARRRSRRWSGARWPRRPS